MDERYFIDANVPMYAVGADHPLKRPCLAVLRAVARGDLLAVSDAESNGRAGRTVRARTTVR
ncbi:MAG TPA: hypothetical protein VGM69_09330 [Chloroflexota bacterium]|jgi:predicted nucleic acid-binding protein